MNFFSTANQRIIFLPKTLLRSSVQNCWDFLTQTCGVEKSGRGLIIILEKEDHFQDEQASKLMMNRQIGLEFEKMQEMKVVLQQQNLLKVDSSILAHFSIQNQNRNSPKETKAKGSMRLILSQDLKSFKYQFCQNPKNLKSSITIVLFNRFRKLVFSN